MFQSLRVLAVLLALFGTLFTLSNSNIITRADDKVDRSMKLRSTGVFHKAEGRVWVENKYDDGFVEKQKVKLKVEDLPSRASFRLFVDGVDARVFNTDEDGEAEIDFETKTDVDDDEGPGLPDGRVIEVRTLDGVVVLTNLR